MKNLLNTLLDAFTTMAIADPDYWLARQYFADPEAAGLVTMTVASDVDPAQSLARSGAEDHARSDAPDVVAEVEALLAEARRDPVGTN